MGIWAEDHDPIIDQDFTHSHYILFKSKGGTQEGLDLQVLSLSGCLQHWAFAVYLLEELIHQKNRPKRNS